jgi:hypothetical protein
MISRRPFVHALGTLLALGMLPRERAKVKGLAVPGMVVGSPGMEQGPAQPHATLAFDERGSQVYERH